MLEGILQAVLTGAVRGLGQGADLVAMSAKRHAPVRSVFAGTPTESVFREKNIGEIMSERTALVNVGLRQDRRGPIGKKLSGGREGEIFWRERRMGNLERMLAQGLVEERRARPGDDMVPNKYLLSKRGAYEVRSRRAMFSTFGHQHIGGRLRASIHSTPPQVTGNRAEAWVIAGGDAAPYARYQEMGTRHNAAHPFLRPAAEESREEVVDLIADAIKSASRTGAGRVDIEVMVRL